MTDESLERMQRMVVARFVHDREFIREQFWQIRTAAESSRNGALAGALGQAWSIIRAMPRVAPATDLIIRARHNSVGLMEGQPKC